MILIALVCVLISATVFQILRDRLRYSDFYKIKGPLPIPIFGNALLLGFTSRDVFLAQLKLAENYGGFFRLIMGDQKVVVLSDPELVGKILSSPRYIKKSAPYMFFRNWLGNGLLISSGNRWRTHRKMLTPAFHFNTLPMFASFMKENIKVLLGVLSAKTDKLIEIHHLLKLFTLDTICESAMRYKIDSQLNSECGYIQAIKRYLDIHMTRFFSVLKRSPTIFKLLPESREQTKCVKTMHELTDKSIDLRKEERQNGNEQGIDVDDVNDAKMKPCFLDRLLDMQRSEKMTDVDIRDEVSTFVFGGHDTTASSISFCLYELAKHPEVQQRLVEESWTFFGKNADVNVNTGDIQEMTYLDLVIKECLRMHTTVPLIERELEEDVVLDSLLVPKGTNVQILIYAMHHSEKYYPDPEKFDPERFTIDNFKGRHQYAYIPFSAGPRNCIGFKYGILLTKAAVINILRNFELLPAGDPKYEPLLCNNAILESQNGVHIRIRHRKID